MANARVSMVKGVAVMTLFLTGCEGSPAEDSEVLSDGDALTIRRPPVRLVAPLSGAIVGSRRPLFRWAGPPISIGEVCRDRNCRHVVSVLAGSDHSAQPVLPLPAGPLFWRVQSRDGHWSAPWELFVPGGPGRAARAVLGFHYDANGDGLVEAVVRALQPAPGAPPVYDRLHVYSGHPGGIAPTRETVIENAGQPVVVGDINGDGYGDIVAGAGLYAGGPSGISTPPSSIPSISGVFAAGDIDGDGYGDIVGAASYEGTALRVALGSPSGLPVAGVDIDFATSDPFLFTFPIAAADLDGDGYGDVVLLRRQSQTNELGVGYVRGGPGGLLEGAMPSFVPLSDYPQTTATGDVNGDGIADFILVRLPGTADIYFGSPAGLPATPSQSVILFSGAGAIRNLGIGDFNGDGIFDVAASVTASTDILFFDDEHVDIHLGSTTGLKIAVARSLIETDYFPDNHNRFGSVSATAGDFNGDGRDDVLIGASTVFPPPLPDGFPLGPSDAFVFRGVSGGVSPTPAPRLIGEPGFGVGVAASSPSWELF